MVYNGTCYLSRTQKYAIVLASTSTAQKMGLTRCPRAITLDIAISERIDNCFSDIQNSYASPVSPPCACW